MLTRDTKHDSAGAFSRRLQPPRASWGRTGASIGQAMHRAHLPCRSRLCAGVWSLSGKPGQGYASRSQTSGDASGPTRHRSAGNTPHRQVARAAGRASPGRRHSGDTRRCQRIPCVSSTVHFRSKRSFRSSPLILLGLQAVCVDRFRLQNRSRGRIKTGPRGWRLWSWSVDRFECLAVDRFLLIPCGK